jgi:predicted branched-subunit amino acid permease
MIPLMPRYAAFLVGIVVAVALFALYQWVSWVAAYGLLAVWLAATVLYRRHQRRRL